MSQIFKINVPTNTLFTMLDNIGCKDGKYYIINNITYKKGVFNEIITKFIEQCIPYYHTSKRKYLERKLTYGSFVTIIRQICNANNIKYTSTIKYDKSKYDIHYYIYFEP